MTFSEEWRKESVGAEYPNSRHNFQFRIHCGSDLEDLEKQTGSIVFDLKQLGKAFPKLSWTPWRLKPPPIVNDLKAIEEVHLDAIEAQVDRVLAKLATVKDPPAG